MKLLYCISGTYNSGGMERVLSNKANYLAARGYDIVIVTTDQRGKKPFFPLDKRIKCIDIAVNYETNNGKSFFNKLIHYPFKQIKHKYRLERIIRAEKPDIVISMFCNDVSFLPSIKDGSKKVLEIHFSRFKRLQYDRKGLWRLADKWRNRNEAKQVSRFDKFVVLTNEDKKYWGNLSNIFVIPNAQTFVCGQPVPLIQKKVVAIGRYTYQKGFDLLLKAWALVCMHVTGWQLHIVGDGELREALQRQVSELGLEKNVCLCPATTDIKTVYQQASLLVMSSRYEGFGMVLLEAQTAGVPVVSFDCKCGPSEIIKDGITGYLIPEGDIQGMADKILTLISNEGLRKKIGKQAFDDSSRFSEERIMKLWVDLFDTLLR